MDLVKQLMECSSVFGYGEIREHNYGASTTLMNAFSAIADPRFIRCVIRSKSDVYPALRTFFSLRERDGMAQAT